MPWSSKDAKSHTKKADSPEKQKKWADIANNVRSQCLKDGGDESECDAKAIRVANSKMDEPEDARVSFKIPKEAMNFTDSESIIECKESEDGKPKLKMEVYSGKTIEHPWWGKLAIDSSGGEFKKRKYPVLFEHDTSKQLGFTIKPIIEEGGKVVLDSEKTTLLENQEAKNFVLAAKEGFPFEASISIRPKRIENVEKGKKSSVNGHNVTGPFSIIREWEFREASVCTFGADRNTSSSVFSESQMEEITCNFSGVPYNSGSGSCDWEDMEPQFWTDTTVYPGYFKYIYPSTMGTKEVKRMTLAEMKEQMKEQLDEFKAEILTEPTKVIEELKAKCEDSDKIITSLKAEKDAVNERMVILEKKDAVRTEKELKAQVDSIFEERLSESTVPSRYWDKVKSCVSSDGFIKDLTLDVVKFTEAVDAEIKDWEDKGVTTDVLGSGKTKKEVDKQEKSDFNAEDTANQLLKLAGQKI